MIRALICGDIMGKPGRMALEQALPELRERHQPDVVIINGENSAGGFGISEKVYKFFIDKLGIDCVTLGNHWHDKKEVYSFSKDAKRLVIPANAWNVDNIEVGYKILELPNDKGRYAVINLLGNAFMHPDNRPAFQYLDKILDVIPPSVKVRFVDFHAEATSEKQAMGHYCLGRASMVYGTHSHVPCADERIIGSQTGFVTDVGMTGGYDSVIGIRKDAAINRLLHKDKKNFEPATQDPWLCAIVAHVDEQTGNCQKIERLQWRLQSGNLESIARTQGLPE